MKHLVTVATEEGTEKIHNPQPTERFRKQQKNLHQQLARRVRGSRRREQTKRKLARLSERKTHCRSDHAHKTTIRIVRESQAIAIEDLNVKGMSASARGTRAKPGRNVRQKAGLNRAVLDASFGEVRRQLEYKTDWHGRELVKIDRFAPTSKRCSSCGERNSRLTLADRQWRCEGCGAHHDRDENAAKNIRALGLETIQAPGGTGNVRGAGPIGCHREADSARHPG